MYITKKELKELDQAINLLQTKHPELTTALQHIRNKGERHWQQVKDSQWKAITRERKTAIIA